MFIRKLPSLIILHLPIVIEIAFIANHNDLDVFVGVAVDFVEPARDVVKGGPAGDVVDEEGDYGAESQQGSTRGSRNG